jgi:release factor glutamine methyltransferase
MGTVSDAVKRAETALLQGGVDGAALEARDLVASFLKTSRTNLQLKSAEALTQDQELRLADWIGQRARHAPLAYLTQEVEFAGLGFFVNAHVLIPRPETEELFELMLGFFRRNTPLSIADVGTGSGVLAVSLAKHFTHACVWASDISDDALAVAQKNAARHSVGEKLHWRQGDLWHAFFKDAQKGPWIDLAVANLPYIREDVIAGLDPEVQREPRVALSGGADGLRLIRKFLQDAPRYLKPRGRVFLEIGFDQGPAVVALMKAAGFSDAACKKDLSGHDRFTTGQLQ